MAMSWVNSQVQIERGLKKIAGGKDHVGQLFIIGQFQMDMGRSSQPSLEIIKMGAGELIKG